MRSAPILLACLAAPALAQPLTPTFTYQGELSTSGSPAAGPVDLRFRLYASPAGGPQIGPILASSGLPLLNGRFAVQLDFGPAVFTGERRWLEIDVSPAGAGTFSTLVPRQELAAAPHATFASRAANASTLDNQPASFYLSATNLTGTLADARLSTNVPRLNTASTFAATVTAPSFVGALTGTASNASSLNNQPASFYLNAANLTGTLADARLSANVPLRSAANTFAAAVTAPSFVGPLTGTASNATNLNNQPASFYLNAANLTGTLADARLSANVPLRGTANIFNQPQTITTPITLADALTLNHILDLNAVDAAGLRSAVVFNGTARVYAGHFDAGTAVSGVGVYAQTLAVSGPSRAVWGKTLSFGGHAAYFEGRGFISSDLGVGTESPEARLHVFDGSAGAVTASSSASAVFERNGSNYLQLFSPDASERGLAFGSPAGTFLGGLYYTNTGGLNFRAGGNTTRMVVSTTGDVGVGTGSPTARLDVAGDIKSSSRVLAPAYANTAGESVAPVALGSFDQFGSPIGVPTGGTFANPVTTGTWTVSFNGYSNANDYAVLITARGTTPIVGTQVSQAANGITIRTFNLAGALTAAPFNIVIYRLN